MEAFYEERLQNGSTPSYFDRIVLLSERDRVPETEFGQAVTSMTGVPFDRRVSHSHLAALLER